MLTSPDRCWSGPACLDANTGTKPLDQDFDDWAWSRASQPDGTLILYDGALRPAGSFALALHASPGGDIETFVPPAQIGLPDTSWWRIARRTRADRGQAMVLKTQEDTPFYFRSLLSKTLLQQPVTMIHESLSMHRFRSG
jgi:carotenoid 1,2-hydratase